MIRALLLVLALLAAAPAGAATLDHQAVAARLAAAGDALVAAYDPAKGEATGDGFSDLYFSVFEESGLEADIGAADADAKGRIESEFASVIGLANKGAPAPRLAAAWTTLKADVEAAASVRSSAASGPMAAFLQSLLILLREGFEAILVIAALAAYLRRLGAGDRLKVVWGAVALAVAASLATAVALSALVDSAGPNSEAVGGVTMIVAAAVLAYVSHWLFARREAARWQGYIRGQVEKALSGGQVMSLGFAAFLAVYREGAETVLFYQALVSGAPGQGPAVGAGFACAVVGLGAVYWVMRKASMKLPLGPFFAGTAVLLYALAVAFAGQGVLELQEARWLAATPVDGVPRLPLIGLFPTAETLAAQAAMLALLLPLLGGWAVRRLRAAS
ncbi:MAG: FTR1 family iron permease [Actinomycetota bacterium]